MFIGTATAVAPIKWIPPSYKRDAEPQGSRHDAEPARLAGPFGAAPQPTEFPPRSPFPAPRGCQRLRMGRRGLRWKISP